MIDNVLGAGDILAYKTKKNSYRPGTEVVIGGSIKTQIIKLFSW